MDLVVMIRNTANMTERARLRWRSTPRWHFVTRYRRRENYLGWQRKLDELRQKGVDNETR